MLGPQKVRQLDRPVLTSLERRVPKEHFFDGTKARANADIDSLTPRFAQAAREPVTALFGRDAAADAAPSAEPPSREAAAEPTALPGDAAPPAEAAAQDATALPPPQ